MMRSVELLTAVCCVLAGAGQVTAAPPAATPAVEQRSPQQWIAEFRDGWNEPAWVNPRRGVNYMRPLDDTGWKVRMRALQGLVCLGQDSVEPLQTLLREGAAHERIFAAQALSFLAPHADSDLLWKAAREDEDQAVRLYAIDALGNQGRSISADAFDPVRDRLNRDCRMHAAYATQRADAGLPAHVVKDLCDWNPATIDSARLNEPAPDFSLPTMDGRRMRLSDYRGKQAVVLVFIYGDT